MKKTFAAFFLAIFPTLFALAQSSPSISPTMVYTDSTGVEVTSTEFDGSAPLVAHFAANPSNVGSYQARYEWQFRKGTEQTPFLTRFDEETDYTFRESGSFSISLLVTFINGTDTVEIKTDTPFNVNIRESILDVPNIFTPNGDNKNDKFRVKSSHQSIIEFKAMIFDRQGRKIYEWDDIKGSWDGRSGGRDMPEGGYYLYIKAKGADGKEYNIKKVINLLRGYTETAGGS